MIRSIPLRAELFRLTKTRSTLVLLLLPAIAAALRVITFSPPSMNAGNVDPEVTMSGFGPMADGIRVGSTVLTLAMLVLGALSLVREREAGGLGLSFLARPRGGVVLAKASALLLLMMAGFALLGGVAIVLASWRFGLGPIVDEGFELATTRELWTDVAWGIVPSLPGLLAMPLFGLLVSSLTSSSGGAVAWTLVPVILVDVAKEGVDGLRQFLFVTYAPLLGDGSPLTKLPAMARAYSDAMWDRAELAHAASVPMVWGVGFVLLAMWITRVRSV